MLLMDEIHWEKRLEQLSPAILTYPQQRQERAKHKYLIQVLGNATGTLITENYLGFSNNPKS